MLPFLEELLEKKLSDALGAKVSFDRVKLSPLSGKVEALNLAATAPSGDPLFLKVPRIEAKIGMARALKQEISIQSLRIERPYLRLPIALPRKAPASKNEPGSSASKPWQFEADDVLVVDGTIEFQSLAYHAIAEKVNLSLKRDANDIVLTLLSDSVRRINPDVSVGGLKLNGRIATSDFSRLLTSSISVDGTIDPHARFSATTASLMSKTIDARVTANLDSHFFSRLIPIMLPAIAGLIHLDIDGTFSPERVVLRRGEISTANATLDLSAAGGEGSSR